MEGDMKQGQQEGKPRRLSNLLSQEDEAGMDLSHGRKGSVVAEKYRTGEWRRATGDEPARYPTNEEVAKAVQQKVAAAVEMSRKYRHVAWYSLFVGAYMVVLYLQASAYKSGEVVETLKQSFMPDDGSTTMTFQSEDDVLKYLGTKVLLPIWKDPVCGDGNCEYPWEFPVWGRFGCRADCGMNRNTTKIVVNVKADFSGHPTISPRVLMANAKWNLCLEDDERRKRGEADLCWYDSDQTFDSVSVNAINAMDLIDGKWYVVVKGDYAGRVSGSVYDLSNSTNPTQVPTSPAWTACKLTRARTTTPAHKALRRLLQAYTQAHKAGGDEGRKLIQDAVEEIQTMPELNHINFTKYKIKSDNASTEKPAEPVK